MTSKVSSVAVVVPARNAEQTLGDQLAALAAQGSPFHLVVVDSHSDDGTAALAETFRAQFEHLTVVTAPKAGTATARNLGVAATTADFIAFCDADDRVRPGWLSELVEGLAHADIAFGRVDFERLNDRRALLRSGIATAETAEFGPSRLTGTVRVMGGVAAIRRSTFIASGGFDQRYDGIGNEDGEFYLRAQLGGATVAYRPDAVVDCRLRDDYGAIWRQARRNGRGVGVMYRQHGDAARSSGIEAPTVLRSAAWAATRSWWLLAGGQRRRSWWIRSTGRAVGFVEGFRLDAARRGALTSLADTGKPRSASNGGHDGRHRRGAR